MGKQKLPADLAPAPEAEKTKTICVDKQRDALAVAQVIASTGVPPISEPPMLWTRYWPGSQSELEI